MMRNPPSLVGCDARGGLTTRPGSSEKRDLFPTTTDLLTQSAAGVTVRVVSQRCAISGRITDHPAPDWHSRNTLPVLLEHSPVYPAGDRPRCVAAGPASCGPAGQQVASSTTPRRRRMTADRYRKRAEEVRIKAVVARTPHRQWVFSRRSAINERKVIPPPGSRSSA